MFSQESLTREDLPSTSYVLNNIDTSLRPKEAVACMNCPLAVWMLKNQKLECYCRTLYQVVWETAKPGKITMCDAPEQARLAAEPAAEPTRAAPTSSSRATASSFLQVEGEGGAFGLLSLGEPGNPEHEYL